MSFIFASFYRFLPLNNLANLQNKLQQWCEDAEIKGTILLAPEGINANIVGEKEKLNQVIEQIEQELNCDQWEIKYTPVNAIPFARMKVKIKPEIITFGVKNADPNKQEVGTYISAEEWNNLITQSDVTLIDTRNDYEVEIGTFQGAINPHIDSFKEFNEYIDDNLNPEKDKKVAVFCTGGIRCEKVTALMLSKGFKEVYHLKGGILKYLQEVPAEESLWEGECFVFDERVAVKHGLEDGSYQLCPQTGNPISKESENSI